MKIDPQKFLTLVSLMSAPLVSFAPGCIITDNGDDSAGDSGSANTTASTTASTTATATDASASDSASTGAADSGSTGAADSGSTGAADSGSTGAADSGSGSDSGGIDVGDCCEAHETGGCTNEAIQECVCAMDEPCCASGWDDICVEDVDAFGCGMCGV